MSILLLGPFAKRVIDTTSPVYSGETFIQVDDLRAAIDHLHEAEIVITADPHAPIGGAEALGDFSYALKQPRSQVKWIQVLTAGYESLYAAGVHNQVQLTHQGGAVAPHVAEHALGLLLGLARQVDGITDNTRDVRWSREFSRPIQSLAEKTLLIIGYGHIGQELAKRAKAFGVKIVGVSRSAPQDAQFLDEAHPLTALPELLPHADLLVLSIALSEQTRNLIDGQALSLLKPNALLVNVSRGGTVNSNALNDALRAGQLAGAALDVTEPEPLPADHPLWEAPNLLISPHTAGAGNLNVGARIASTFADNLRRFRNGEPLLHKVAASGVAQ
jgi:phosphoglycerate dehydrogenase-like enzyme